VVPGSSSPFQPAFLGGFSQTKPVVAQASEKAVETASGKFGGCLTSTKSAGLIALRESRLKTAE
jgi:hypothetical protein